MWEIDRILSLARHIVSLMAVVSLGLAMWGYLKQGEPLVGVIVGVVIVLALIWFTLDRIGDSLYDISKKLEE